MSLTNNILPQNENIIANGYVVIPAQILRHSRAGGNRVWVCVCFVIPAVACPREDGGGNDVYTDIIDGVMADGRFVFESLPVAGAFVAESRKMGDARGFFARMFCMREFGDAGFSGRIKQTNISESRQKGTLRGMHYQLPPKAETKIISVLRGAVWDVVLDLRPSSPTFGKYAAAELSADNGKIMCAPKGCAHGYITLADNTMLSYLMDEYHAPEAGRGVRWDDPAFGIDWPIAPVVMSAKDKGFADFSAKTHL